MEHDRDLAYWRCCGYTEADVIAAFDESPVHAFLVKLRFTRGLGHFDVSAKAVPANRSLEEPCNVMKQLLERDPSYQGSVLYSHHDGIHKELGSIPARRAPVLSFGKTRFDHQTLLIPDPFYNENRGYEEFFACADNFAKAIPWEKRLKAVFWRGSTTGSPLSKEEWELNLRIKLSRLSQQLNDPIRLDAFVSRIVQCDDPEVRRWIEEADILRPEVPFTSFFPYAYQLDIDGNSCSWSFFQKLGISSVVFKVQSENMQWFYPQIRPWEHFIPVKPDLSDLIDLIDWARAHDKECCEIARNARELTRRLNYEYSLEYTGSLLSGVLACQR